MCVCFGVGESLFVIAIAWILKIIFNISFWVSRTGVAGTKYYWRPRRITLKTNPPIYRWRKWNFGFTELEKDHRQPNYTMKRD